MNRFDLYVQAMTRLVEKYGTDEAPILDAGAKLLSDLVSHDDWLPAAFGAASPEGYRQYLLHCDPEERFCVVSFVLMPGQKTPIHDHTVWGMVGTMRGEELCQEYSADLNLTGEHTLRPGKVDLVSPRIGDIHAVSNPGNMIATSIHTYGANIGTRKRHWFDPATGQTHEFISGYHNTARSAD
ncbi:MAG: cysteine dioxygenase [Burkholderiales bacterium]